MQVVRSLCLMMLALVLTTGCGQKALTTAEKAQFKQFNRDSGRVFSASAEAQKAVAPAPGASINSRGSELRNASDEGEREKEIQRQMVEAIKSSCEISPITTATLSGTEMTVGGPDCPIDMKMKLAFTLAIPMTVNIDAKYVVRQDSFAALSDVSEAEMIGRFTTDIDVNTGAAKADGTITGSFLSKNHGRVPMKGRTFGGFSRNGSGEITTEFTYEFRTLPVIKASVSVSSNGVTTYRLNGEKLTKEQWEDFFAESLVGKTAAPTSP